MSDVWSELGIEPTNDERAIKRAYAKRLKVTSPEDNPQAFETLRQAYERALQMASFVQRRDNARSDHMRDNREHTADAPKEPADIGRVVPDPFEEVSRRLGAIEDALDENDEQRALDEVRETWGSAALHDIDVARDFEVALRRVLSHASRISLPLVDTVVAHYGWTAEQLGADGAAIDHLLQRVDHQRVTELLERATGSDDAARVKMARALLGHVPMDDFKVIVSETAHLSAMAELLKEVRALGAGLGPIDPKIEAHWREQLGMPKELIRMACGWVLAFTSAVLVRTLHEVPGLFAAIGPYVGMLVGVGLIVGVGSVLRVFGTALFFKTGVIDALFAFGSRDGDTLLRGEIWFTIALFLWLQLRADMRTRIPSRPDLDRTRQQEQLASVVVCAFPLVLNLLAIVFGSGRWHAVLWAAVALPVLGGEAMWMRRRAA